MYKKLMWVIEVLEEELLHLTETKDVLPKGEVFEGKVIEGKAAEREIRKWQKRTQRISITRTERISKGNKEVLKFIRDLIAFLTPTPIPQYLRRLIMWIFRRPT